MLRLFLSLFLTLRLSPYPEYTHTFKMASEATTTGGGAASKDQPQRQAAQKAEKNVTEELLAEDDDDEDEEDDEDFVSVELSREDCSDGRRDG